MADFTVGADGYIGSEGVPRHSLVVVHDPKFIVSMNRWNRPGARGKVRVHVWLQDSLGGWYAVASSDRAELTQHLASALD